MNKIAEEWEINSQKDYDSKYAYFAESYFNVIAYDDHMADIIGREITEVIEVILNRKSFDYIENDENYKKYIIWASKLDEMEWIEWGTSIRGAWLNTPILICGKLFNKNDIKGTIDWLRES